MPRDLFNEAKLLKCMGRLMLNIHDGLTPVRMGYDERYGKPFEIALLDEGALTIANLKISILGKLHRFKTTYNSKANYPLFVETPDLAEIQVFDDDGTFSEEFKEYCNEIPLKDD